MSWLFDGAEEINRKLERGAILRLEQGSVWRFGSYRHRRSAYGGSGTLRDSVASWRAATSTRLRRDSVRPDLRLHDQDGTLRKSVQALYGLPLDSTLGGPGETSCTSPVCGH